ncbi:MAG: ABC transporter permease [Gemmatimonadaceae bacterium]|nr:ABC transporter permease [Gemmatimonadaceae bacterium]
MAGFLLRRLGHAFLVMLVVCTVTFGIVHTAPGGPSLLADPKLSIAERAAIAERLGIDRPVPEQYVRWLVRVARGDLGHSFLYETSTVSTIMARLPATLLLAGTALLLTIVVAVPVAARCADRPGGWLDRIASAVALGAISVPVFWLGILAILAFAVHAGVLPAGGSATAGGDFSLLDRLRHLVLPAIVLASAGTAELFRYTRESAAIQRTRPFVRTARAKGVPESAVRWRHAMRNAYIPVVTVIGLQLPRLVGGAAITETVFSWPGMGRLGIEAALARDYPLIMGITLLVSVGVLLASLLVDLAYVALDPRVRPDA